MADRLPVDDVVVLLPGILGSVLERDGKEVWALSRGAAFRGLMSLGGSIKDLRLGDDDPDVDDLGDGVRATRLMPDVHLIPGFWKIDGYGKIKRWLFDRFDFEDGVNWFDFPYDWRRDNRVAARRWPSRCRHGWPVTGTDPASRTPSSSSSGTRWAAWSPATSSRCSAGGRRRRRC